MGFKMTNSIIRRTKIDGTFSITSMTDFITRIGNKCICMNSQSIISPCQTETAVTALFLRANQNGVRIHRYMSAIG